MHIFKVTLLSLFFTLFLVGCGGDNSDPVNSTPDIPTYKISVVPSAITLTKAQEQKVIDLYVEDNNARPVAEETILLDYFDGTKGTMNTFSAKTDANGHVSFIYTAPDPLPSNGAFFFMTFRGQNTTLPIVTLAVNVQKDTNGTLDKLLLLPSDISILKANESKTIQVLTLDSNNIGVPSTVVIEQPNIDGKYYGSFSTYSIATDANGIGSVVFTTPSNIDTLVDTNKSIKFKVLNTTQETDLTVSYEKNLNLNKELYEIGLTKDSDIAVDSSGELYVSIYKSNLPSETIDSAKVLEVNVSAVNYNNMVYFDRNDPTSTGTTYSGKAQQAFSLFTKQTSGIVILEVSAKINDGVSDTVITGSFPIVINSGEMSSMSLFYARSELDTTLNIYKDYYTIHAVDKYGNPVSAGTVIHPTLINGTKIESLASNGTGELQAGTQAKFKDTTVSFDDINTSDRLIVLPSQDITDKRFFGNWDIISVDTTIQELTLFDKLDMNSSANLRYVIGNEKKVVTSNGSSSIALAHIQAINGIYETDNNGNLQFIVAYDPALKGQKVYLAANGQTSQGKVGVALEAIFYNTGKKLVLEQNNFEINIPGEKVTIDATLYDEASNLITYSPKLKVLDFNNSWGTYSFGISNSFIYTAPENTTEFNALRDANTTMTFKLALEETDFVYATVTIDFKKKVDYSNYSIQIVPDDFVIEKGGDSKIFKVYLFDANNNIVVNERLVADFFDTKYGQLDRYAAIISSYYTNYATFRYTAPNDITSLAGTAFDFNISLENDTAIRSSVKVNYVTRVADVNYSKYNLTALQDNILINYPNQSKVIDLYLEAEDQKPAENEVITLDFFDGKVGTVNSFSAVTDVNGHVAFEYTAPSILPDSNSSLNFHFTRKGVDKNVSIGLYFNQDTVITQKPNIHVDLANSILTLTQNAEAVKVKILAFNSNNEPFNSGTIIVQYPDAIVDGNVSGGQFLQSEVAIVNGEAVFDFVGPDPLQNIQSLNFTFVYKESTDVKTTLTVAYAPVVPTVILPDNTYELKINSEVVNIDVDVYDSNNNPYPDGKVKIVYPNDVKSGRDIGSFAASSVTVTNGIAQFIYTAPSKLDANTSDIVFKFYHESNPTGAKTFTFTVAPAANQTVLTDYELYSSFSDGNVTMELNSSKLLSFAVRDNNNGNLLSDNNITSMTVTLLNPTLATLQDNNGNSGDSLILREKNNVTVIIKSDTISGIVPIRVDANFVDINGNNQTLSGVYNVLILSGPPTTISLSYAGTEQDETNAKFIEKWVLTVTDKYNNRINTNPSVSMGMLAGYTQSSAKTSNIANYLYYRSFEGNGTLDGINDIFTANSNIGSSDIFGNVDQTNDYLVTFGNGYTYNASGKWSINTDITDTSKLDLIDDYTGATTSNLGFAVGNNKRQDACEDGIEWNGNVYPKDNNYIIDSTGSIIINVSYDYYMVGKDVVLWVNLLGQQNSTNEITRIGEARKVSLRGMGISGETYNFSAGFKGIVRLHVTIDNTVEYLKNANFGYAVEVTSDDANWTISDTSMRYGITYCYGNANQNGEVFVDVNFTSETPKAGSVSLTNTLISNEF